MSGAGGDPYPCSPIQEKGGGGTCSQQAAPPPPPPPSKRDSLRALAMPLIRRYSQQQQQDPAGKIGLSPWSTALNSVRAREKRQMEVGINKFNLKPAAGIDYLINNNMLRRTPEDVAAFFRNRSAELSKRRVGEYLGSPNPFNQEVLAHLLDDFDFAGMALDEAMRVLIKDIRFPGESQQIDRILMRFASRYYACNRGTFATEDCVYILSFSLMLLNTDLHNRRLKPQEKMRQEDFIKNNRGINNGQDLPRELLVGLYGSIKRQEMRMREGEY